MAGRKVNFAVAPGPVARRWQRRRMWAAAAVALVPVAVFSMAATAGMADSAATAARAAVESDIAREAAAAGGEVGVYARHLESGLTLALNSQDHFPMASTFKVAVAGAILARIDSGELRLDQLVPVEPDLVLSSEGIAEVFPFPGLSVSIHNLIESMLTRSDNTATNVLTRLVGGAAAVTGWVRQVGVQDLRVDGDTNDIVRRFVAVPPSRQSLDEQLKALLAAHPEIEPSLQQPNPAFDNDPRDTTTPVAMVALLTAITTGRALSPASTEVLLGALQRDVTGLKRLRAMLPPGTPVGDKTGTLGGTVNDVGIIDLPDGRGHIVVAVYIKKSPKPLDARERVIAQIGRSVYDYMRIASTADQPARRR